MKQDDPPENPQNHDSEEHDTLPNDHPNSRAAWPDPEIQDILKQSEHYLAEFQRIAAETVAAKKKKQDPPDEIID